MSTNEMITAYLAAKEQEKKAKKQAETLKALILEKAGNNPLFETDCYSVFVKRKESTRLDTKALYADFPDIKETYGKTSVSLEIDIAEKTLSSLKTA